MGVMEANRTPTAEPEQLLSDSFLARSHLCRMLYPALLRPPLRLYISALLPDRRDPNDMLVRLRIADLRKACTY